MSAFKPLPMFEALFTRQLDITPADRYISRNAMCRIKTVDDLMLVAHGHVVMDNSLFCVPYAGYTADEDGFRVHYLIVGTSDGAVAISEHGKVFWTSNTTRELRRAWRDDREWAGLERVILKAMVCGTPMHRLMRYLATCTSTPQSEYTLIATAINELASIMGNDEIDLELDS